MVSDSVIKRNLIGTNIVFVCGGFNVFLLTFYLKYMPGNIYYNNCCFAGSDILGYILGGLGLKCLGVSRAVRFTCVLSGIGGALYLAIGHRYR